MALRNCPDGLAAMASITIATEIELPLFYAVSAIGVAFTGGGAFSLDAKFDFTIFGELYSLKVYSYLQSSRRRWRWGLHGG
jgi:hypothetical protein